MPITAKLTLETAEKILPAFETLVGDFKYEDRGIFFSELLFLWAATQGIKPRQVVESGRARGLSTATLSKIFPESRVVSLEYEAEHPDAHFAEDALSGIKNIALLYGDANILLPALLLPGDIALIDGPKGMPAVALAFQALATGKPEAVFIHDCYRGQKCRKVLDELAPGVFYSDDSAFVTKFHSLDASIWANKRKNKQDERYGSSENQSYGPTLACIPRQAGVDYAKLSKNIPSPSSWFKRIKNSLR